MTTTTPTPTIPDEETQRIIQHLADTINGIHKINGHFLKMNTTITDGVITVEITRRGFGDTDDCAIRLTLTPSTPELIEPAPVPDVIGPRSAALLEIWAPNHATPVALCATEDPPQDAA